MPTALALMQQVRRRLLRQKQLNVLGFFVPLVVSGWALSQLALRFFSFPQLFTVVLPAICCGFLGMALWKARTTGDPKTVAAFLDSKIQGKERFLTLVTTPRDTAEGAAYSLVERQAEQLSASLRLERDLPLIFDRRILLAIGSALISVLLLLFLPVPERSPFFSSSSQEETPETVIAALEETARPLMQPTATPQEQTAGAQLLTLAQQLKDPSLSPQEKHQLIEEAQKRLNLNLPLPQLLPFDLKIFANKGKENTGQGNETDTSQKGNTQSAKTNQNINQSKTPPSPTTAGGERPQNAQQSGEKKEQTQSRQEGGGISFNFPQPQSKEQNHSQQESSAPGQQSSQEQAQDSYTRGDDPNRPGEGQDNQARNQESQGGNTEKPGEGQSQKSEGGANAGQGKGERSLKPGEQPGGGFLTKDARFVKVRVPIGQEAPGEEGARTENHNRATPKTPYSNAPLKEAAPDQTQAKQPIPLEYRSILKD